MRATPQQDPSPSLYRKAIPDEAVLSRNIEPQY